MNLSQVLLRPDEYDGHQIAHFWHWLLRDEFDVLHVTVFGNLVLTDQQQRIWLLDSWSGQLHGMSESYDEYKSRVATDTAFFQSWFLADLVSLLTSNGLARAKGTVFSPLVSPGVGGSLSIENFVIAPVRAYAAASANEAKHLQHIQGQPGEQ